MDEFFAIFCLTSVFLVQASTWNSALKEQAQTDFGLTIPPECEGQELCLEHPVDYPTEEIDQVAKRLARRYRRQSLSNYRPIALDNGNDNINNCVEVRKDIQPFLYLTNTTQYVVIQSHFFEQVIPSATCSNEGKSCLKILETRGHFGRRYCQTKQTSVYLIVYDFMKKKVRHVETIFPVACNCKVEV